MARSPTLVRRALALSLRMVGALSRVVPPRLRKTWRQEWQAELQHEARRLERRPGSQWQAARRLVSRTLGALPDAVWLRRQLTRDAELLGDGRYALRLLRANPGFTAVAGLMLALGIGANTALFSLADAVLLRPLPYPDAGRLVTLWEAPLATPGARGDVAPANFIDWRERARSFAILAGAEPYSYDDTSGAEPEVLFAVRVTEGFFDALALPPLLGRTFTAADHTPGRHRVAVLSHALWHARFGGDRSIVGRHVRFDDEPFEIVGVMPPAFEPALLPTAGARGVWTPKIVEDHERRTRGSAWWNVVGRLRPGVTIGEAQAEMDAIARQLGVEFPRTNHDAGVVVRPMRAHLAGELRVTLLVLIGAVACVLLIACANVATLMIARGSTRAREVAIRAALGAGRGRLTRQLLHESAIVAAIGAAGGLVLAHVCLAGLSALAPVRLLIVPPPALDLRVLIFTMALATATAALFGLAPAWHLSRPDLEVSLRDGPRAAQAAPAQRRLRGMLVVAEVALAIVLAVGAGLFVRSFARLLDVDPGFRPDGVVALQVFAWDRNPTPERRARFFEDALEALRKVPGVTDAGAVSAMPFIEANINIQGGLAVEGRPALHDEERPSAFLTVATPDYFRIMGIPVIAGRTFDDRDTASSTPVALVSETLARRHWPGETPEGRHIVVGWQGRPRRVQVVGVVASVRHDGLDASPRDEVFLPHAQLPYGSMTFVVGTSGPASPALEAAKAAVRTVDPLQAFYRVAALDELVSNTVAGRRFTLWLLAGFAGLAVLLALAGLHGVIALAVAQRHREIGVRLALGARPAGVLWMVAADGVKLTAAGAAIGLPLALVTAATLRQRLFGVSPADPMTLFVVPAAVLIAALTASLVAARGAVRIDPARTLQGS